MSPIFNPFEENNQNLHSYIPRSRINLIDELLFYLRTRKGIFRVYSETGNGGSFILSQIYKLLKAHENVFYLDGKKILNAEDYFKKELKLKPTATQEDIVKKIKSLNVKGKHSIFLLEHFEKFEERDFIYITDILKQLPQLKLLILGNKKRVKILSKNLKTAIAYTTKLRRLSFVESYKYIKNRFQSLSPSTKLSNIVHRKALLFIAFVSHGKPQILNKVANESLQETIKKNKFPLTFRQTLMTSFKFRMITYPFFPINWGLTFIALILLITAYLFYLPISRSINEFREERVKQLIERDMKNFKAESETPELPTNPQPENN
jgi:hypothetical protein